VTRGDPALSRAVHGQDAADLAVDGGEVVGTVHLGDEVTARLLA
jgi:hypothetical protein